MNDDKSVADSRCHLQQPSRKYTCQSHRYSCNHPRLQWILWCFEILLSSRFSNVCFPFLTDLSFLCLTTSVFAVIQGGTVSINLVYYKKQTHKYATQHCCKTKAYSVRPLGTSSFCVFLPCLLWQRFPQDFVKFKMRTVSWCLSLAFFNWWKPAWSRKIPLY